MPYLWRFVAAVLLLKLIKHPPASAPEGMVFQLYKEYAWEAVLTGGPDGLMQQPREVLESYFDTNLASLILKDRACVKKRREICKLDFDPIWASQDPSAGDLNVEKTKNENIVKVQFRYPSTDERIELLYRLTKTSKGWRISDISSKQWSLLAILSSKE